MRIRIKELRVNANKNAEEMARLLDCDYTTYKMYETQEIRIPISIANKLAKYHNVSLKYLMGFSNNPRG